MEKDTSRILFDKYFSLSDRTIEVVLKSGRRLTSVIIGFWYSEDENDEPPVKKWHIVDKEHNTSSGFDNLGIIQGEIIKHCDIDTVYFFEDKSILKL